MPNGQAVAITRKHIREQIKLIRALHADGQDSALARRVLSTMLRSLAALRWAEEVRVTAEKPLPGTRFDKGFAGAKAQATKSQH